MFRVLRPVETSKVSTKNNKNEKRVGQENNKRSFHCPKGNLKSFYLQKV